MTSLLTTITNVPTAKPFPLIESTTNPLVTLSIPTTEPCCFTLYVPFAPSGTTATVTASAILQDVASNYNVTDLQGHKFLLYDANATSAASTWPEISMALTIAPDQTLYVPYVGSATTPLDVQSLIARVTGATSSSLSTVSATSTASSSGRASSSSTASSPLGTPTSNSTAPIQQTPQPSSNGSVSTGALAGAIVGSLLAGALISALIFFCFARRRKSRIGDGRSASPHSSANLVELSPTPKGVTPSPSNVTPLAMSTWRKHLPQERDDDTVREAFNSLFDRIEMHVETFYMVKATIPSQQTAARLQNFAPEDYPIAGSDKLGTLELLEGVLTRWIIHKISLRCDPKDSLLPAQYTFIPRSNDWHMERSSERDRHPSELKKGFPEALSEWRTLQSFLLPQISRDTEYQQSLKIKIDHAIAAVNGGLGPWAAPGNNVADQNESLRQILQNACRAGMLLFTQSESYVFEWAPRNDRDQRARAAVLAPALVKYRDDRARLIRPEIYLLEARCAGMRR